MNPDAPETSWRATNSYCVTESGDNTGYQGWNTLEQYDTATGQATGTTKPNVDTDPDYIAPVQNENACPLPEPVYDWRGINLVCLQEDGENTGYEKYQDLEEYDVDTNVATGNTKPNVDFDPNYIPPVYNENACPVPQTTYSWRGLYPYCQIDTITENNCIEDKVDILFILDATGSMSDAIQNLKSSLSSIVANIETKFTSGYRLALMQVVDEPNYPYYIPVSFSDNNESEMQTALNGIGPGDGDDKPEPTDLALDGALNGEAGYFRKTNTAKVIFIITDAIPWYLQEEDNSKPLYKPYIEYLSNKAKDEGVVVFPIAVGTGATATHEDYPKVQEAHDIYASITGGVTYNKQDGVIGADIIDAIDYSSCEGESRTYNVNTGHKEFSTIEQINDDTGQPTGVTKNNDPADPDYVAPVYDDSYCEPGELYITLANNYIEKDTDADGVSVQVYSNTIWEISSRSLWIDDLRDVQIEYTHDGVARVAISENTGEERVGSFDVRTPNGSIIKEFIIRQAGVVTLNSITLAKGPSGNSACENYDYNFHVTRYIDGQDLFDSTVLANNSSGTDLASSGWYSDGSMRRYWTGSSFTGKAEMCNFNGGFNP